MADLITTIKVNSSQFDNSIKESTNQIRKFKDEADKTGGSVNNFGSNVTSLATGALSKMMGALGAAVLSYEALSGVINSTDATADEFAMAVEEAKSSVDYFMTSIATADFSNF